MGERQNTIVCCFDLQSPRINAYHVHEWIYEQLHLQEESIRMIQFDPVKRYVCIKFKEEDCMNKVLQDSEGRLEYKHDNGEITQVTIEVAGYGTKRLRITRLPPEITESDVRAYMTQYGEVKSVRDELWNSAYRYKVFNGVRIADMKLKKHIPSHLNILGYDALIAYDGQPQTCYRCNEVGHQRQECPRGKRVAATTHTQPVKTWADIVSSRIQAHSPDIPTVQNPPSSGNKTKRQHALTDETPDKEYMSGTHDLQDETDGKSMETTEIENEHKNQDISDIGDVEMNPSGYLEVSNSTRGLSGYRARRRVADSRRPVLMAGLSLNFK